MAVDLQTLALELDTGGIARGEKETASILDRLAKNLDAIVAKSRQVEKAINAALNIKTAGNTLGQAAQGANGYADALNKVATSQQKAADEALRHEQAFARLLQAQGKNADAVKVLERALDGFTGSQIQATRAQIQLTNLQNNYANSPLIGAVRAQSGAFGDLNSNVNQAAAGFNAAAQSSTQSESGFRKLIGTVGTLAGIFSDLSSGFFFFNSQRNKLNTLDLSATQSDTVDAVAATQSVVRGASKALDIVQKLRKEGAGALKDIFQLPEDSVAKAAEQVAEQFEKATDAAKDFSETVKEAFTTGADTGGLLERLRVANENSKAAFRAVEEEEKAERRRRRLSEEAKTVDSERQRNLRAQLEENARIRAKSIAQEASEERDRIRIIRERAAQQQNIERAARLARFREAREREATSALPLRERARRFVVEFIRDERGEASVLQGLLNIEKGAGRTSERIKKALADAFQGRDQKSGSILSAFQGGDGVIDRIGKGFGAVRERGAALFSEITGGSRNAVLALGGVAASVGLVTAGYLALGAALAAAVPILITLGNVGIRANSQFEQTRIGIASVVSSVATLRDAKGVKLEGVDALNAALPIARKQLDALRVDALQTALEFQDIAPAFLQAVGPGLAAGLNLDQIRKTVVDVSQLIVPLTGDASQLGQELRSIFSGDIGPDSGVARALQITKQQIDAAKEAGTLAEFLNEKLKAASATGRLMASTFEAAASNLKEAGTVLAATVTEGLFDSLRTRINETLPKIFEIAGGQVKIAPAFAGIADTLSETFSRIGAIFGEALEGAFRAAQGISAFLSENKDKLNELVTAGTEFTRAFGAAGIDAGKLVGIVIKLSGAFKLVTLQLELAGGILRALETLLSPILKIADAIGQAFDRVGSVFGQTREEVDATKTLLEQAGKIKIGEVEGRSDTVKNLQGQLEAASKLTGEQAKTNQEFDRFQAILSTLTPAQQTLIGAYGAQAEKLDALKRTLSETLELQQALARTQRDQLVGAIAAQQAAIEAQKKKNEELNKEIVLRDKLLRAGEKTKVTFNPAGPESKPVIENITEAQAKLTEARQRGVQAVEDLNAKQAQSVQVLRGLLPQLSQTEEALLADVQAGRISAGTYETLRSALGNFKSGLGDATVVVNQQTDAIDKLTASLENVNKAASSDVDKRIKEIALRAKTSAEAKQLAKQSLTEVGFGVQVENVNRVRKNEEAVREVFSPTKRTGGGSRGGRAKELSELEQLQKQLREVEKDVRSFRDVLSPEFGLRIQLEDARRFKSDLEEIISLRRDLNEPLRAALPSTKAGADKEIERLKAIKELREAEGKFDARSPFLAAQEASIKATIEQTAALDKLVSDALPKTESATTAAALAQNEYYQALLKTNPALAEYYRQQADAADATLEAAKAQELFSGLQDSLSGKLDQFRSLTEAQSLALELQKDKYKSLTDAQREQLLAQAGQIDAQNAYRDQLEQSQRALDEFASTTTDLFQALFESGPKAFFDQMLSTLKRTLARMAAEFATSKVLKLLGLSSGAPATAGAGGGGLGGLLSGLSPSGSGGKFSGLNIPGVTSPQLQQLGGGSALTPGFAGGNPAQQILSGGGGQTGPLSGLLSKIPGIGKFFAPSVAQFSAGGKIGANIGSLPGVGTFNIPGLGTPPIAASGAAATGGSAFSKLFAGLTNPVGLAITAGLIAAPFITKLFGGLFGGGEFKGFQKEVNLAYQVKVANDKEGKGLFEQSKQLGEAALGKGALKKQPKDVLAIREVKDLIAAYGEKTDQQGSALVRQFIAKRDLGSVGNAANSFTKRAFGGSVSAGSSYIVGDGGRSEVFTPYTNGQIFPSLQAFMMDAFRSVAPAAGNGRSGGDRPQWGLLQRVLAAMMDSLDNHAAALNRQQAFPAGHVVGIAANESPQIFVTGFNNGAAADTAAAGQTKDLLGIKGV